MQSSDLFVRRHARCAAACLALFLFGASASAESQRETVEELLRADSAEALANAREAAAKAAASKPGAAPTATASASAAASSASSTKLRPGKPTPQPEPPAAIRVDAIYGLSSQEADQRRAQFAVNGVESRALRLGDSHAGFRLMGLDGRCAILQKLETPTIAKQPAKGSGGPGTPTPHDRAAHHGRHSARAVAAAASAASAPAAPVMRRACIDDPAPVAAAAPAQAGDGSNYLVVGGRLPNGMPSPMYRQDQPQLIPGQAAYTAPQQPVPVVR